MDSARPWDLSLSTPEGRCIYKWLLSNHRLEVETGRFNGIARAQRYCVRCFRETGLEVLGDEAHAITTCIRASSERHSIKSIMRTIFLRGGVQIGEADSILQMMSRLKLLSRGLQRRIWQSLGRLLVCIDRELMEEMT